MVLHDGLFPAPEGLPTLTPLMFLPMHLGNAYFISRGIGYTPVVFAISIIQYMFEHYSHLPEVASAGVLHGPSTGLLFICIVSLFVTSFRKGQTSYAVAALIGFTVQTVVFTLYLQGMAPETVEASVTANNDVDYLKWHFPGHVLFWGVLGTASATISWEEDSKKKSN
ncbi:hypothetical protein TrCOL_g12660 [Triparma columacea]|uniref:Uncharacterized protein n=1 Tax=Triparma columacea TaxID=722753 RepID=A0A9W7GHN7_9STRA|nr:hypothetical protein TrCOL_g12660 [Triparma columacea]